MLTHLACGWEVDNGHRPYRTYSWIRQLEIAREGDTRLGESTRRSTEWSRPALARLTDNDKDSFAGSPRELLDNIHDMLTHWVEVVNVQVETLAIPGDDRA
jgi:ribosomal protein S12 methylthiotransferase accessory factor YcaO